MPYQHRFLLYMGDATSHAKQVKSFYEQIPQAPVRARRPQCNARGVRREARGVVNRDHCELLNLFASSNQRSPPFLLGLPGIQGLSGVNVILSSLIRKETESMLAAIHVHTRTSQT